MSKKPFLADFHIHSTFSDGRQTIPEIVDLFGSQGFGAIAITDHLCEENTLIGRAARYIGNTLTRATFPLYCEVLRSEAERAWDQYRMILLPGIEFTKNTVNNDRSAHILGIGGGIYGKRGGLIDIEPEFVSADQDAYDLAVKLRREETLVVAAHPVPTRKMEKQTYHLWNRRRELSSVFDAWEVASGPYLFHEVMESGLPMLASSDMHVKKQMTSWKTLLECEQHPEAILRAIRQQDLKYTFYEPTLSNHRMDLVVDLRPAPVRDLDCA